MLAVLRAATGAQGRSLAGGRAAWAGLAISRASQGCDHRCAAMGEPSGIREVWAPVWTPPPARTLSGSPCC